VQTFATLAPALRAGGFVTIPILPGTKRPSIREWPKFADAPPDDNLFQRWVENYPGHGVGIVCGEVVGIDIDILADPDLADYVDSLAQEYLGDAPVRIGRWPKRLRMYRLKNPIRKLREGPIEILASGQQFVAAGIHPDTGKPYRWLGVAIEEFRTQDFQEITESQIHEFLLAVKGALPDPRNNYLIPQRRTVHTDVGQPAPAGEITHGPDGLVVDGRDAHLSRIAFHALRDSVDAGVPLDPDFLAAEVWERFADSTDLSRTRKNLGHAYSHADAREKVVDKLRLYERGSLPERFRWKQVGATVAEPTLPVENARETTKLALSGFVDEALRWHKGEVAEDKPPIAGIRVSTGVGKCLTSAPMGQISGIA
jgi:hypothetical protein